MIQLPNINLPSNISYIKNPINKGADGFIFDYNDKIVKLFRVEDYSQVNTVLNYLIENPQDHLVSIYECGYLDKVENYFWMYYICEKLLPISIDEEKVFHTLLSHEDRNLKKDYSADNVKKILRGLAHGLDFDEKKVTILCDAVRNCPIKHLDIHPRNIMKDVNGNFKLVDLTRIKMENLFL